MVCVYSLPMPVLELSSPGPGLMMLVSLCLEQKLVCDELKECYEVEPQVLRYS